MANNFAKYFIILCSSFTRPQEKFVLRYLKKIDNTSESLRVLGYNTASKLNKAKLI